jgi:hypothetical protein
MSAFYAWAFVSVGNFVYAFFGGDFDSAFERSYFQGLAIAIYHFVWK